MAIEDINLTQTMKDSNKKAVTNQPTEVDSLVQRATTIIESTVNTKDLPSLEQIVTSEEVWNKNFDGHEEKKASLPEIKQLLGVDVESEIPQELHYRYKHLVDDAVQYGFDPKHIRIFRMNTGLFKVTTPSGVIIATNKIQQDTKEQPNLSEEILDRLTRLEAMVTEIANRTKPIVVTIPAIPADVAEHKPTEWIPSISDIEVEEEDETTVELDPEHEVEKKIVKEYKNGVSCADIMGDYDISAGTMYSILNKHNIPLRSTGSSKGLAGAQVSMYLDDDSKRNQLIKAYTDGVLSLADIYIGFDITKNGLFYILDKYRVPRRMPTRMNKIIGED